MNAREVLHAVSGLLLVLAAGLFVAGLFAMTTVLAEGFPTSDTPVGAGMRLAVILLVVLAFGMGLAGAIAGIAGKAAERK